MNQQYVVNYTEKTFIKFGQLASPADIKAKHQAFKDFGLNCIGESWVAGYGISPVWRGPSLDEDTQNLLCVKAVPNQKMLSS